MLLPAQKPKIRCMLKQTTTPSAVANTSTINLTGATEFGMNANFFVVQKDDTLLPAPPLPSLYKFTANDSLTWCPDDILETEITDEDTVVEEVLLTEGEERGPDSNAKGDAKKEKDPVEMNTGEDEDESGTSTRQDADDSDSNTSQVDDVITNVLQIIWQSWMKSWMRWIFN